MKDKVLAVLKNTDGYVSGQELCEELGVSRTAVWKNYTFGCAAKLSAK